MNPNVYFISGGVKSGKSKLAQHCIEQAQGIPHVLVTARIFDSEMQDRVAQHQKDRPIHWITQEVPIELPATLQQLHEQPVLIDCLGVWLTNLLIEQPEHWQHYKAELLTALRQRSQHTVVVSNEVGWGVIGADALTRQFVDELGKLNQSIAALAGNAAMTMSGLPLWLKAVASP